MTTTIGTISQDPVPSPYDLRAFLMGGQPAAVKGIWVSYHPSGYDDATKFAVHRDEVTARRFAMASEDPYMRVTYLGFDVELADVLKVTS